MEQVALVAAFTKEHLQTLRHLEAMGQQAKPVFKQVDLTQFMGKQPQYSRTHIKL